LNKHVTIAFFGLTGVCMGIAQHLVDLALATVRRKSAAAGVAAVDPVTKRTLGQAVVEVDAMFAAITDVARRTDEIVFAPGRIMTPVEEARMATANVAAGQTLRRVLDLCLDLYGSRYIFDGDPMQRVVRDAYGALAHTGSKPVHFAETADAVLAADAPRATLFDEPWRSTTL
jgi:alkylation response protein AidB-like acyl-CoA dehydrogenase